MEAQCVDEVLAMFAAEKRELDAKFPRVVTVREIVTAICRNYEPEPETLQQKSRAAKVTTAP
jgi:hypothetical protein